MFFNLEEFYSNFLSHCAGFILMDVIFAFLNTIFLQLPSFGQTSMGSQNPWIQGMIASTLGIVGIAILLNLFTAVIRRKMVDQDKLKKIMREVKLWQKERLAAFKTKNQEKIDEVNKKSAYMNKMNMEMMQMNMRPTMILCTFFINFLSVTTASVCTDSGTVPYTS